MNVTAKTSTQPVDNTFSPILEKATENWTRDFLHKLTEFLYLPVGKK